MDRNYQSGKGGDLMEAPCMKVKCGVTNCTYNKSMMCYADALEVNAMEGKHKADISDETCCTTFKDKE
ncbi:protein of unknown function DUF1540 [Pseudobacteroides cellulosolvens ATCC 35603 = DSM 2933]|uniref:DUF1540 domain-containing protein n=2 Tax=Pseudobacteroides cellulosolvens TaxID=35825 RepID=A0A0L6JRN9_9FIRM|nr:protein of unknown function DUF1540 [Pseudobacteroides cellulosolvens ATCC 35603 = DSM 2933]